MSTRYLKIKIKTLAAEARIIRVEEKKRLSRKDTSGYRGLYEHRTGIVRSCARSNLLAYGFLRGRSYAEMEPKTETSVDFAEIVKHVRKFGAPEDFVRWDAWYAEAIAHLKAQKVSLNSLAADPFGLAKKVA